MATIDVELFGGTFPVLDRHQQVKTRKRKKTPLPVLADFPDALPDIMKSVCWLAVVRLVADDLVRLWSPKSGKFATWDWQIRADGGHEETLREFSFGYLVWLAEERSRT